MQHVVLYFRHDIRDIIPFHEAVRQIRLLLEGTGIGEYVDDDIAIDGGDAEAILQGPDADKLYATIWPILKDQSVMRGAEVALVYGPLNANSPDAKFEFNPDMP